MPGAKFDDNTGTGRWVPDKKPKSLKRNIVARVIFVLFLGIISVPVTVGAALLLVNLF